MSAAPRWPRGWSEAAPAGVPVCRVDLDEVSSKAQLLGALARALSLEADFGYNWDALYDALTNLNRDTALEFVGQRAFAQAHAPLWDMLTRVLLDAQDFLGNQSVALWLVIQDTEQVSK